MLDYKVFVITGMRDDGSKVYYRRDPDVSENVAADTQFRTCSFFRSAEAATALFTDAVARPSIGKKVNPRSIQIEPINLCLSEVKNTGNCTKAFGISVDDPVIWYCALEPQSMQFVGDTYRMFGTFAAIARDRKTRQGAEIYDRIFDEVSKNSATKDISAALSPMFDQRKFNTTADIGLASRFLTPSGPEDFEMNLPRSYARFACSVK